MTDKSAVTDLRNINLFPKVVSRLKIKSFLVNFTHCFYYNANCMIRKNGQKLARRLYFTQNQTMATLLKKYWKNI